MASVEDCRKAIKRLAAQLASVDADVRARHVPRRTVACRLNDLDVTFSGRLDEDGVHDVVLRTRKDAVLRTQRGGAQPADPEPDADVRLTMDSDELVALADGTDDFLHAWLRGRIQVSASMRDLLRLRSLFGL